MRRRLSSFFTAPGHLITKGHTQGTSCGNNSKHHHSHSHSHSHGHHHHEPLEATMKGRQLRQCQLVTAVGGTTNVFFCFTKLWIGASGGSVALVADGFHSLFDLLADVVSYAALTLSTKRLPRCRFPFGIGRIETAGAVVVATILLLGGVTLLFQSLQECQQELSHYINDGDTAGNSMNSTNNHQHHHGSSSSSNSNNSNSISSNGDSVHDHHGHSHFQMTQMDETGKVRILWAMVWVCVASIVSKELLFRWTKRVGERAGSRVVVANAYHHRADAWSGGVALVGVAGHLIGMPGIDGIAGLCVSYSICRIGYSVLRNSVLEFFDFQNADEVAEVRKELRQSHSSHHVNVFLIRHGHSYALHATLLVEAETPAATIVKMSADLTDLAKQSIAVTDTCTTPLVCDPHQEASLLRIVKLVEEFHGLKPISCHWEKRQIIVHQVLQNECMEDVRTIASFFGMEVIVETNDSDTISSNGCCH
ncbi:cation transporter [Trypanosoma theileri]|uniref:Cation transporter n=1 Tax=Trypanosoma theileri TaxID=67003 RepID=A0A1X0P615_9TRYP|nr:cation transporter [Trypanosoma theileri]ORC92372.1 cation transporter [Trypanosoma theileri]